MRRSSSHHGGAPEWIRSSYSIGVGACVEVRFDVGTVSIRDSKYRRDPDADLSAEPIITVADEDWDAFLADVGSSRPRRAQTALMVAEAEGLTSIVSANEGTKLTYTQDEWKAFVSGVRAAEFSTHFVESERGTRPDHRGPSPQYSFEPVDANLEAPIRPRRLYDSCYVAGALGDPWTKAVERYLADYGMEIVFVQNIASFATDTLTAARAAIQRADLAVLVVVENTPANVWIEAGIAFASGKQVIAAVDAGVRIPSTLDGVLTVALQSRDLEPLLYAIDALQASTPTVVAGEDRTSTLKPIGTLAGELLQELEKAETEKDLLSIVSRAVEASGAVYYSEGSRSATKRDDFSIDLGIWTDDLASIGANPLLVEVKRVKDVTAIENAVSQVENYLGATGSRCGLVSAAMTGARS